MPDQAIESAMQESRTFSPSKEFTSKSLINNQAQYERMYKLSINDPDAFWGQMALDLWWFKKWDKVLQWELPNAKWFVGATTNLTYNCLDRQIELGKGDKSAILWEGEPET